MEKRKLLCDAGVAIWGEGRLEFALQTSRYATTVCVGVILVEWDKTTEDCVFTGATTCR